MNKKLLVFVLVVLFAVATASSALYCQSLPKVSMTFEDNMDADTPEGKVSPTVKEKPALVPGRNGMALKSGPGYGYLEFPSSLLNASAGTVEMWVCPLDWTEKDEEFHVFFDVQSEKGTLFLYKYHQANAILMLSSAQPEGPLFSSSKAITWKPGEWHHIAGTWSDAGVMAYVDGEPAGMLPVQAQLPTGFGEFFTIGDIPWHIERKTSSLIDNGYSEIL